MRLVLLISLLFAINDFAQGQQSANATDHPIRDSVFVVSNAFDPGLRIVIDTVEIRGNKVTRPNIILREFTFGLRDTIPAYDLINHLKRTRENLLNTSLFNFVTIHDSILTHGRYSHVIIHIELIERWYLWPFPIFEISDRNFNSWWQTKDPDRISYGLLLLKENMRGRKERLNLLLRFGYDEKYELSYDIPFINKKQTFGATLGMGFSRNHEVAYRTRDNKLENVKDSKNYLYTRFYSFLGITHRPSLYQHHLLQLGYNFFNFADTVLKLNPDYSFNGKTQNEYLTLLYRYSVDYRDSKNYPLHGRYIEANISKSGFNLLRDGEISMMDIWGSYRHYWQLSRLFYLGTDWTGKISTSREQPYFYQQGLGYGRNFVRGYELYVVDGQSFVLSKNTLKFNLVPTRVKNIGFLKSQKFGLIHYALYLNWYIDAGYVDDFRKQDYNDLSNSLLLGTGIGLDVVTYYDMVLRFEFSVNRQGEPGFFFHVANTL
jgi:outer membrane protein assembly factor BamA